MSIKTIFALSCITAAAPLYACSARALVLESSNEGFPQALNPASEPVEPHPTPNEDNSFAVVGNGEMRRIVLHADMAGDQSGWQTPACWADGDVEYTSTQGCEPSITAGEQLVSNPLDNLPATVALITAEGWCVPTLGEPTLYNTAICENGFNVGLPISGCDDAAPIAFVAPDAATVATWVPLLYSAVAFEDQRSADLSTELNREDLPAETTTWWRMASDLYEYRDTAYEAAVVEGTVQTMDLTWRTISVGLHVDGVEECDDAIATYGGIYVDSPAGFQQTTRGPVVTGFVYSADLDALYGLYVSDTSVSVLQQSDDGIFEQLFSHRYRFDNEECISRPGEVLLEYECGP